METEVGLEETKGLILVDTIYALDWLLNEPHSKRAIAFAQKVLERYKEEYGEDIT